MPGPLITSDKIVTVTYDSRLCGQQILNTFHYRTTLMTGTGIELTAFYAAMNDEFGALVGKDFSYASMFTAQLTNIKRRVQVLYPVRYMASVNPSNNTAGLRPVAPATPPPDMTAILTFRTLVAVPRHLSNIHIPITDVNDVDSGNVQASLRDPMNTFANDMRTSFTLTVGGSNVKLELIVPKTSNLAASNNVDAHAIQPFSRVLRRRGVQLGS